MIGRITKILDPNTDHTRYIVRIRRQSKYLVELNEELSPTDVEDGMRVGVDKKKYSISLPLPPRIDPKVSVMTVEERPDVTYNDIGGYKDQIDQLKEVLELPLLNPQIFSQLGIDPPKGVLLFSLIIRTSRQRTCSAFPRRTYP